METGIMETRMNRPGVTDKAAVARFVASVSREAAPDNYSGKRQATRFSEGVQLEVTPDPDKPSAISTVYMHNVSEGGFAFWSRKKIMPRTTLYVRECSEDDPDPWLQTYVTHCTLGLRGFLIGAAFDDAPNLV